MFNNSFSILTSKIPLTASPPGLPQQRSPVFDRAGLSILFIYNRQATIYQEGLNARCQGYIEMLSIALLLQ
jgi:hypothetical protein